MIQRFNTAPLSSYLTRRYSILVPNQSIREALLSAVADGHAGTCWLTPDINAIDIWIKRQWQTFSNRGLARFAHYRLLDSIEESAIWLNLVEADLCDAPLLNAGEAADAAQQAYQLYRLWLDEGSPGQRLPPGSAIPELSRFRSWSTAFQSYCGEHGLICLADATRTLVEALADGSVAVPEPVLMLNFYQPPPLYARLFDLLSRHPHNKTLQTADNPARTTGSYQRFPDFESECQACAWWAKELIAVDPGQHIGIVFSGDEKKKRQVRRWFSEVLAPDSLLASNDVQPPFNDPAAHTPLLDIGLINEALLILGLDDGPLNSAEFCRLLHSAHLCGSTEEREQRIHLHAYLLSNLGSTCSLSQLLRLMSREHQPHYCPQLATALLKVVSLQRANRGLRSARDWRRLFQQQLELLGWPGPPPAHQDTGQGALAAWRDVLARFGRLDPVLGAPMERGAALARLRTLCQKVAVGIPFAARCPLSLLSVNDAVGLEFSHLWFLDWSDQRQPAPPHPSPFLAHAAQRAARIPGSHGEVQLARSREAFAILCRSVDGQLRASFHEHDGDDTCRPSSLLEDFTEDPAPPIEWRPLNCLALARSNQLQPIRLCGETPPILQPDEQISGGQAVLSDQSSCSFRAFATHRLGARPLETFSNGLSPSARGTAVHIALEAVFKQVRNRQELLELRTGEVRELAQRGAAQALDYLRRRFPELMAPRFSDIELKRLAGLVESYLELEKQRGEFQVIATEKPVLWQHDHLQITLKIDRLDRLDDGTLAVIDYKTGKTLPGLASLLNDRPENLQLPLYQLAVQSSEKTPVAALVFAQLNIEKCGYTGLAAGDNFHSSIKPVTERRDFAQDWAALSEDWQSKVNRTARQFGQGYAAVNPVNGPATCTYCRLQPLCRIHELQPEQAAADAGEK